jgi:hypothetical protein
MSMLQALRPADSSVVFPPEGWTAVYMRVNIVRNVTPCSVAVAQQFGGKTLSIFCVEE